MRIVYIPGSDPMVLDTRARLNALYQQLNKFLASATPEIAIRAEVTHSAATHQELLKGLRVRKTRGPIDLHLTEDRWLELTGSESKLTRYAHCFHFGRHEDERRHPPDDTAKSPRHSPKAMRLIIDADSAQTAG